MSEQRHKIQKQIIELHLAKDAVDARQLQSEFSRIYRRRIVPIIDQYCTELSTPDQLHHIDSLEIDLGEINPAHLETEVVAKFQLAMRKALTAQLDQQTTATNDQKQSIKTESQIDLLWHFAQTGTLPWWADAQNPHILQESLHLVLDDSPTDPACFDVNSCLVRNGRFAASFPILTIKIYCCSPTYSYNEINNYRQRLFHFCKTPNSLHE